MLPTIEQCQEFKRLIDVGRAAAGYEPIEYLEFDNAIPGHCEQCLSSINLFGIDGTVLSTVVETISPIAQGLGLAFSNIGTCYYDLPRSILVVTNPFDGEEIGLRDRLVEAGVVEA